MTAYPLKSLRRAPRERSPTQLGRDPSYRPRDLPLSTTNGTTRGGWGEMATAKVLATSENYRMLAINKDNAHYAMAQRYNTRHTALGVAAIVTSAIVSTVIFSTVAESPQIGWRVATGIISATAAMLAALQTFLKLSEQAERHITSEAGYSRLRRQLELFQLRYGHGGSTDDALDALAALGAELDSLETSSPPITETIYDETRDRFAHERKDWT